MSEERIEASVGGQKIGIVSANLLPLLMLAIIGMAAYLSWQTNRRATDVLQSQHYTLYRALNEHTKELARLMATLDYNCQRPIEERLPMQLSPDLLKPRRGEGPR